MKAIIVLANGFEESEAIVTHDVLVRAGIDVVLLGLGSKIIESSSGLKIITDGIFSDTNADVLVLPGGRAYRQLMQSSSVRETAKRFYNEGKVIAAICAAPLILADLGILEKHKATVYPGLEGKIPHPRDERVIEDGNIITANGPGSVFLFALKIVEHLLGKNEAMKIKREMVV